jgi:hypothetical protein
LPRSIRSYRILFTTMGWSNADDGPIRMHRVLCCVNGAILTRLLIVTIFGQCFTHLDINAVPKWTIVHLLKPLLRRQQGAREARARVRGKCSLSPYSGRPSAHARTGGTYQPVRHSSQTASLTSSRLCALWARHRLPIRTCIFVWQSSIAGLRSKRADVGVRRSFLPPSVSYTCSLLLYSTRAAATYPGATLRIGI